MREPTPAVRRRALLALTLCLPAAGCQYLADRALDFTDQFRGTLGAGTVVGARARTGGALETGLMIGVKPRAAALGWSYGTPLYFYEGDRRFDADQAEVIRTTTLIGENYTDGSYTSARQTFLVPALLTWVDSTPDDYQWHPPDDGAEYADRHWLWSAPAFRTCRYQQIHAFDIEGEVGLFVYASAGYSPGELVDFLLGLLFIDIAADDGRL
jgi:hypothetical protein